MKEFWKDIAHFAPAEFDSPDAPGSGGLLMDAGFMKKVNTLRNILAAPLTVSSGYRTPEHNKQVSETGATGPHTTGRAVDFLVEGELAYKLIGLAFSCGFTGIGVSQKGPHGRRFVHLDDLTAADGFPRPRVWSY